MKWHLTLIALVWLAWAKRHSLATFADLLEEILNSFPEFGLFVELVVVLGLVLLTAFVELLMAFVYLYSHLVAEW